MLLYLGLVLATLRRPGHDRRGLLWRILRSGSNSPCTSCRPAGPACSNATASSGRSWLRATKTTSVLLCCAAEIRADVHPRQNQNGCIIRAPHPPCSLCTPGCGRSSGARRSFACATASAASRWLSLATGSVNSDPTPKSPWRVIARILDRVCSALELDDVTLVLHDLGGVVGLQWAVRHPDQVRAIVATNTFAWSPDRLALRGMLRLMGSLPMRESAHSPTCCRA